MRNYLRRMEREGVQRVKMFLVITAAYIIFWGPLFFVTLVHHPAIGNPTGYEVIRIAQSPNAAAKRKHDVLYVLRESPAITSQSRTCSLRNSTDIIEGTSCANCD